MLVSHVKCVLRQVAKGPHVTKVKGPRDRTIWGREHLHEVIGAGLSRNATYVYVTRTRM